MVKITGTKKHKTQSDQKTGFVMLTLLLVLLLPLLFSTKTIDPVLSIRLAALNWITLILTLFWFYHKKQIDFTYLKKPVFAAFLLYLIVTAVSLMASVNPAAGFYDLAKTFLSLQIMIVATGILLTVKNPESILSKAAVINVLIGGTVGIVQYLYFVDSATATGYFANLYSIGGLMGHKNQFAISLFLLLPFAIYGLFAFRKLWLYLSVLASGLIMANFALLQTRSVWIAFWIWFVVAVVFLSVKNRFKPFSYEAFNKKQMIGSVVVLVLVTAILIMTQPKPARHVLMYKISSMTNLQSEQNTGRLDAWAATLEIIKKHPFTGVGAGNWKVQIPAFFNEKHGDEFKNWHQPHNDFLWVLSEKGILGILTYMMLFFLLFRYGIQIISHSENKHQQIFYILLMAAVAGYLAIAFVDFPYDRINHQVILMVIFSMVISQHHRLSLNHRRKIRKPILLGLFIVMLSMLAVSQYFSSNFFKVQKEIKHLYDALERNDVDKVLFHAVEADGLFLSLDHLANPVKTHKGTALLRLNRLDEALEELNLALQQHPHHPNTLNNIATIHAIRGNYDEAIVYFRRSFALFPRNELTIRSLSRALFETGEYEEAYRILLLHPTNSANQQVAELKKQIKEKLKN